MNDSRFRDSLGGRGKPAAPSVDSGTAQGRHLAKDAIKDHIGAASQRELGAGAAEGGEGWARVLGRVPTRVLVNGRRVWVKGKTSLPAVADRGRRPLRTNSIALDEPDKHEGCCDGEAGHAHDARTLHVGGKGKGERWRESTNGQRAPRATRTTWCTCFLRVKKNPPSSGTADVPEPRKVGYRKGLM